MTETPRPGDTASKARRPSGATPEKESEKKQGDKLQKQLDEALADSFPASDPVSIVTSHQEEDWGKPDESK